MGCDHVSATEGRNVLNQAVHGRPRCCTSVRFSHLDCLSSLGRSACSV